MFSVSLLMNYKSQLEGTTILLPMKETHEREKGFLFYLKYYILSTSFKKIIINICYSGKLVWN